MPKIFQFDNSKVERKNRAEAMEAGAWFREQQPLLLWMANRSEEGRKLLRLESTDLGRIDEIAMNRVSQYLDEPVTVGGRRMWRHVTKSDFRVGAKWANLVNSQWDWFCELSREYYSLMERKRVPHVGQFAPVALFPGFAYGSTHTSYPDADPETTTVDGRVDFSTTDDTWANIRGAADGTTSDDSGSGSSQWARISSSTTSGQFKYIGRGFLLFDTSSIGTGQAVSSATFSLWGTGVSDDATMNQGVGLVSSSPASNTALATADYDQVGTTRFASDIDLGSWSTTAYNDMALNASGIAAVAMTGITKFGMRLSGDIDNSAPAWASNVTSRNLGNSAETGAGDHTNDPKLVVTHAASGPAASRRSIIVA